MRTKIDWPDTCRELSGMDTFCGGPDYEDISAQAYYSRAKPIVNQAILTLEQEIDHLQLEVERLHKIVQDKPKVKYNSDIGAWVLVDPREKPE